MSKTIYYLGAGASYGSRDKDTKSIIEGIPVVAEIPKEFDAFRNYIANAVIPAGEIDFWGMYLTMQSSVEQARQAMLGDIDQLIQGIKNHATIDTFARKLYLTRRHRDFEQLKTLLCAFLCGNSWSISPMVVTILSWRMYLMNKRLICLNQ